MPISKTTERNWKRLKRDLSRRPSYRANKTGSSRRVIPKERCSNPDAVTFITDLLSAQQQLPLPNIIYTLSCLLLDRSCCDEKLVERFKEEYSSLHSFVSKLEELELPKDFDFYL